MVKVRLGSRLAALAVPALAVAVALGLAWGYLAPGSAQAQAPSARMALSIDGAGADCTATRCILPEGGEFTLTISVAEAPSAGYIGFQTQLQYGSKIAYMPAEQGVDEIVVDVDDFPGIAVRSPEVPSSHDAIVGHGATAGLPPTFTTSHYEGPVVVLSMECSDQYSKTNVQLTPLTPDNALGTGVKLPLSAGGTTITAQSSPIEVNCGNPPPTVPGAEETATSTPTAGGLPPTGNAGLGSEDGTGVTGDGVTSPANGDNGSSNTGLWIAIAALAVAAAAGLGVFGWRYTRSR